MVLLTKPVIGLNQYLREKNVLSQRQMSLVDYRNYLKRHLDPFSSSTHAILEPLKTPEMRKKAYEPLNKRKKRQYIEDLTKFNPSGLDLKESNKMRISKELLKHARKRTHNK